MKLGEKLRATVRFIGIFMLMALLALLAMPISVHADVHKLYFYVHPGGAGNISPITGWVNVSSETGAQTSFSVAPENGYSFYQWIGKWPGDPDRKSYAQSAVMACSGLTEAHAYMVKNSDTGIAVSSADESEGTVVGTRPWSWAVDGQYFTISATPKDPTKYEFDYWELEGKKLNFGATAEVKMPTITGYNCNTCTVGEKSKDEYKAYFKLKSTSEHGFRAVTGNEGGSITAGAFVPYATWESSGTATAVATPAEDYEVDCWLDPEGKELAGSSKQKQIDIPRPSPGYDNTKDLVYTVKFKKITVTGIDAETKEVDSAGTVVGDGGGAVSPAYVAWSSSNRDQSITLTATPDNGMKFYTWDMPKGVKYSGSITNPSISIVMPHDQPADDLIVTAKFKPDNKYYVYTETALHNGGLITPGHGGTVNPAMVTPQTGGSSVSLTAEPYMGYEFEKWVDLDSDGKVTLPSDTTQSKITITVLDENSFNKDVHIRAIFKPVKDIGIWALSPNGGSVNTRYIPWNETNRGNSFTLSATPDAGYVFDCWKDSDGHTYTSQSISVVMPSKKMDTDIVYIAVFRKKSVIYTEAAVDDGAHVAEGRGGTVSPDKIEPDAGNSIEVTLTATADSGYEFDHWEDVDSGGAITFLTDVSQPTVRISVPKQTEMLDRDVHIRAVFENELDDGIWTLAQDGGTASPRYVKWTDQTKGTSITLTATPNAGYEFDHWIYDNEITGMRVENYSVAPSLSVKMPTEKMTDDIIYTAVFKKINGKTKNKEIHVEGKETSITKENFLNKWRTWIAPALKYVRSTIQSMAHDRTAADVSIYEGEKSYNNTGSAVASSLKNNIDANNQFKHTQSFDHPVIMDASGFSVSEVSGLNTVFVEGTGSITDPETESYVDDKFGELYIGEIVLSGDIYFENEKGERITAELSANSSDATVVMSGIDTASAARWMLVYKDSGENEFIITPITDATSLIRFTLPDQAGGKITLVSVNYR